MSRFLPTMVYLFFFAHWTLCVFFQSFFQHRYAAHRMYNMGPKTERLFHFLTYLFQGASYLSPRAYAILHREHHAFSDTERDPHSPLNYRGPVRMMLDTKKKYDDYAYFRKDPEARFEGGYPQWKLLDQTLGQSWVMRVAWVGAYAAIYFALVTQPWQWLLFPVTCVMGPTHGAIVNWCGHKYGYKNFDNGDASRNTVPFEIICMGELFQNNHHKWGMSPNFAARKWELDPTWQVMKVLAALKVIEIATPQRAVYPEPNNSAVGASELEAA